MNRLHPSTLHQANEGVRLPPYELDALRCGIVHLGIGAFHRAHQAVFTEDAIASSGGDWGITGVSLRSATVAQQLLPQGGLYSVMSEDADGRQLRLIGAVRNVLVAPDNPAAVTAAIASKDTCVITLTITEKGYSLSADGASLDREDPLIKRDLKNPGHPASAIGLLALGLSERVATGGAPLTILSCDNLSENSRVLCAVLVEYLESCFPDVLPWLQRSVAFPCSMVDRIVPAMTDAQKQRQAQALGLLDEGAVNTEPFCQWIIEDNFANERPDWESAGARLVADILPYENIKLRLLNASHSAIAYCGLLAGMETVDEVMADAGLRSFVEQLMQQDLMPALEVPADFDIAAYRDKLLARFANPCLGHRCAQIAMDGSEKIPQRWLPTLQATVAPKLVNALCCWCYFVLFSDLPIDDPRGGQLLAQRESDAGLTKRLARILECARITVESVEEFDALCEQLEQGLKFIAGSDLKSYLAADAV